MKIAVVEIYSHHLFVKTISDCLIARGHSVTLCLSSRLYDLVSALYEDKDEMPEVIVGGVNESDLFFIRALRDRLTYEAGYDLVVVNSIQGYRLIFFALFPFAVKTVAAAGRISEFFGSRFRLKGLTTVRQILHHNITHLLMPVIKKRLSGLIVHSDKALDLSCSHGFHGSVHLMPFSLADLNERSALTTNQTNFLVTGSITERARDYDLLLNAFEAVWRSGVSKANLVVLSSPRTAYGNRIFSRMERLSSEGFPISYYDGWIAEDEYLRQSQEAHYVIAPIRQEYYGSGEITSVEVEVVRSGIIGIFPGWYHLSSHVDSGLLSYDSEEVLTELIRKLTGNSEFYNDCSSKLRVWRRQYTLDKVSADLDHWLRDEVLSEAN